MIWIEFLPRFVREELEKREGLRSIIGNTAWLFTDRLVRMSVGLVVGVWIARYLGPEQFGLWSYAIAFVSLFAVFATMGLDGMVLMELVRTPERESELLGTAFVLKLAGSAITFAASISVIAVLRHGERTTMWLVALSAAGFAFQTVNVIDVYFQGKVESKYSVWSAGIAFAVLTLVRIAMILEGAPLLAFAWAGLAEVALTSSLLLFAYHRRSHGAFRWRYRRSLARQLLLGSWPLLLSGLAVMLYMKLDMIMLEEIAGSREVGIYAAATRLSEVWYFLPILIVGSVSPALIRAHQSDRAVYDSLLRRLYFLIVWMAIGLSVPLSIGSRWIIASLYGAQYTQAAPVFAIHMWAAAAVFLGVASSQHLLTEKLQVISLYRTLIGLACNVGLNLILIPRWGAVGAAVATVISYAVATFALVFFKPTRGHTMYLLKAPFVRN